MNINLSTKERYLLEDAKSHEQLCVQKYTNYGNLASDQQLKDIFYNHAKIEQHHLNSINTLLNGQLPDLNQQQNSSGNQNMPQGTQAQSAVGMSQASDKELCHDMLMTEKYVSGVYNTAIFEFSDTNIRDVLNHLQKEEQKHGEAIFKYMESKGMYTVQ